MGRLPAPIKLKPLRGVRSAAFGRDVKCSVVAGTDDHCGTLPRTGPTGLWSAPGPLIRAPRSVAANKASGGIPATSATPLNRCRRGEPLRTQLTSGSTPAASTTGARRPISAWARACAVPAGTRAPGSARNLSGTRASTVSRNTTSPPIVPDRLTAAPVAAASSAIGRRAATRSRRSGDTSAPSPRRLAPSR